MVRTQYSQHFDVLHVEKQSSGLCAKLQKFEHTISFKVTVFFFFFAMVKHNPDIVH